MTEKDRRKRVAGALLCALAGGSLWYAAWTAHPALRTPPAIGMLAAMIFLLGGVALLLQALGKVRGAVLPVFLLVVAMAGVGGWIGFGPGGRECRGSLDGLLFQSSERMCRAVFGGGALLTALLALLILASMLGKRAGSSVDLP